MKNEKMLSNKMKNGIKKVLFVALKSNANSSGCYVIYQPKVPKDLEKFKKFK
ncbi:cyclic lactone autoinducer peptide [Eubacterium sp. OM08-24]|jgi:cyclic lactone autoinducer peptide|uniref:cyclic lactone autoinducer peptide n=1 Tax=Eubacterium sp. OM08-24 TaxID=2292352 RepID=UPI001FA8B9FD|nr:cyclic lactone autoinducer peptide [Eubacterium sp. OM08-24]